MPKCLECGFEAPRLQWTHFKYKCTGRFNNGREYQAAYPGAGVVDSELAARTAVSLATLVEKYGKVEGDARWESYRAKQAKSNTFEYKQEKYGWTREEFDEYNRSRSSTLENFVQRHGEEAGLARWNEYCERQQYTNGLEYFKEKYGEDGERRFHETNKAKSWTLENVMRVYACSKAEAIKILTAKFEKITKYTSDMEVDLVDALEAHLGPLDYTAKTKQYCVYGNNKANFYDIVHNGHAIEFHGDYWHCHPDKYQDNYYHSQADMLARDMWQRDRDKINLLEEARGIPTLVVWEKDFVENREETINTCLEWLLNEKESPKSSALEK